MSVGVRVRLAEPADFAEIGDITVAAYQADGFLESEGSYAEALRNAAAEHATPSCGSLLTTRG